MKKIIAWLRCVVLEVAMLGCEVGNPNTDSVGGALHQPSAEELEMLGMSAEQFAALDPETQQAILAEIGAVLGGDKKEEETKKDPVTYTPDDVMKGGSYVVVLGDYMNSITLYYENGVLVKLVEDFQKSFEEEAEITTYEGEALEEYGFNFIDWSGATLQEILDGMKDYGGYDNCTIKKVD